MPFAQHDALASSHESAAVPKTSKKAEKTKKGASPYNLFMKEELARVKKDNPDLDHKKAFKMAAENWSKQKNKKHVTVDHAQISFEMIEEGHHLHGETQDGKKIPKYYSSMRSIQLKYESLSKVATTCSLLATGLRESHLLASVQADSERGARGQDGDTLISCDEKHRLSSVDAVADAESVRKYLPKAPRLEMLAEQMAGAELPRAAGGEGGICEELRGGLSFMQAEPESQQVPVYSLSVGAVLTRLHVLPYRCLQAVELRPVVQSCLHGFNEPLAFQGAGADRLCPAMEEAAGGTGLISCCDSPVHAEEGELDGELDESVGRHLERLDSFPSHPREDQVRCLVVGHMPCKLSSHLD
eukprot:763001-Hanusia_phi.AAC.2